jgi:FKBP-type peptidyl-prolyl cis-trans isomerase FkpA
MRFSGVRSTAAWSWMMCLCLLAGCERKSDSAAPEPAAPPAATSTPAVTELEREDLVVGVGEALAEGQVAIVHYTGWLYDPVAQDNKGAKYDTSRDKPQPIPVTVGAGQVIQGWDLGMIGMQVGGQRRLIVPPDLAYGATGAPGSVAIPANAVLVLEIELFGIEPSSAPPQ